MFCALTLILACSTSHIVLSLLLDLINISFVAISPSFVFFVCTLFFFFFFFFSSRRRHTRCSRDWSSDVCSSDLIVRRPEAPLPCGAHRDFGRRNRVGMDTRQRKIDEHPPHLAGLHVFTLEDRKHRHREQAACRALEVSHLIDGDRGTARALGAGCKRILVLRAPGGDEQRRGEESEAKVSAGQGPDLVQMAMTPHWESALRNSAGASLGLR